MPVTADSVNALTPPATVGKPTHRTTTRTWVFMHTQSIYIKYAILGIFCAIALAYVVLLIATNNVIVASAAVLTILSVCACVLGTMVLMGWELGMTESICLTILAGFCVDYIVHFAHAFMECPDRDSRTERTAYAMRHMGISVLSGALTSLGASSLLLFCTLQFFFTFVSTCTQAIILGPIKHRNGLGQSSRNHFERLLVVLGVLLLRHDHARVVLVSPQMSTAVFPRKLLLSDEWTSFPSDVGLTFLQLVRWCRANFFFIPVLAQFGPEGDYGDLIKSKDAAGGEAKSDDATEENPAAAEAEEAHD